MEDSQLNIVCYTGGTCGDLVTAIIDNRGTELNYEKGTVTISPDRSRLKKPHQFDGVDSKDFYLQSIKKQYLSIPSHDLEYHLLKHHNFIGIAVTDFDAALWAANRFKELHRPLVWKEMQSKCGAATVEDYARMLIDFSNLLKKHSQLLITLESILLGNAIESMENLLQQQIPAQNRDFYQKWLKLQDL